MTKRYSSYCCCISLSFRMRRNQSFPKENSHLRHKRPKIQICAIPAMDVNHCYLHNMPDYTFFELHMINLPNVWVAKATIALCNRSGLSAWINSSWGGQRKRNVTIIKYTRNLYQSLLEQHCRHLQVGLNKLVHDRKNLLLNVCI